MGVEKTALIIRDSNRKKLRFVALPNGTCALSTHRSIIGKIVGGKFGFMESGLLHEAGNLAIDMLKIKCLKSEKKGGFHSKEMKGVTGHLEVWKYYSDFKAMQGKSVSAAKLMEITDRMCDIYEKWGADLNKQLDEAMNDPEKSKDKKLIFKINEKIGDSMKFMYIFRGIEKTLLACDPNILTKKEIEEFVMFDHVEGSAIPQDKIAKLNISVEYMQTTIAKEMTRHFPGENSEEYKGLADEDRTEMKRLEQMLRVKRDKNGYVIENDEIPDKVEAKTIMDVYKLIQDSMDDATTRSVETFTIFINYLIKGIKDEPLENKIKQTEDSVILLAPSIAPKEAEDMPNNVKMVVVSEMPLNSHPLMVLTGNDFGVHRAIDDVAKYVSDLSKPAVPEECCATITFAGGSTALYMGLPKDLVRYLKLVEDREEKEHKLIRALTGIERRISGGHRVHVRVEACKLDMLEKRFVAYVPDGIGLVRMEDVPKYKEVMLTSKELSEHFIKLCDISKETIDGKDYYLPVVLRLLDVSADPKAVKGKDARRDPKLPSWATNKANLSGAEYLLSPEGLPVLKRELEAAVIAYLQGADNLRVMIPYVKTLTEYRAISKVFTSVKKAVIKGVTEGKIKIDNEKLYISNIKAEDIDIQLGVMVENKESIRNISLLADEARFFSVGLNDTRYAHDKKTTLLDPELAAALSKVVDASAKTAKQLSTCGDIETVEELIFLLALGFDAVTVPYRKIPEFSMAIRGLDEATRLELRTKILAAKTQQEIYDLVSAVNKTIQEKGVDQESARISNIARADSRRKLREKFNKVHETKNDLITKILKVLQSNAEEKENIISNIISLAFIQGGHKMGVTPSGEVIRAWLVDPVKLVTFFDEWEIREALGMKARVTSYIVHNAPDGSKWARAIPRMNSSKPEENPGELSRYMISIVKGISVAPGHELLDIHYFNSIERSISTAREEAVPIEGAPGRYRVTLKNNEGKEEVIEVMIRVENEGNPEKVVYRKLEREKQYAAEVLYGEKEVPKHAAAYSTKIGDISGLFIQNRPKLKELKLGIKNIEESYNRDRNFLAYECNDLSLKGRVNVHQILYLMIDASRGIPSDCKRMDAVENWELNTKEEFYKPLFNNPALVSEMLGFLSEEFKEDKVRLGYLDEIEKLNGQMKLAEQSHKLQISDLEKKLKDAMLEYSRLSELLRKHGIEQ
jgi:phosphoenolpyruvate-protein kinase (PTS system EI component)